MCKDGSQCVANVKVCMGRREPDCEDGSDEDPAFCLQSWMCAENSVYIGGPHLGKVWVANAIAHKVRSNISGVYPNLCACHRNKNLFPNAILFKFYFNLCSVFFFYVFSIPQPNAFLTALCVMETVILSIMPFIWMNKTARIGTAPKGDGNAKSVPNVSFERRFVTAISIVHGRMTQMKKIVNTGNVLKDGGSVSCHLSAFHKREFVILT